MIKKKFLSTLQKFSLISPGEKILIALSGGPDSVTLLHLFLSFKEKLQVEIYAAHLNHMIREKESERDEVFVKKLCKEWEVPLFVERVNVKELARRENLEATARKVRYQFLEETLSKIGGDKIATGHTASDLLETVLLNLTKGSGLKGLRGFLPKRDKLIKPLFEITRSEIEEYVKKENLPFVLDSSNFSETFERNFLRIKVIPLLKELNPSVESAILRTTETLRLLEDFINKEVEKALDKVKFEKEEVKVPISLLLSLHSFLRRELLQKVYEKFTGKKLSFNNLKTLESLILKEGYKRISLDKGVEGVKEGNFLILKRPEKVKPYSYGITSLPAEVETPAGTLIFSLEEGEPLISLEEFEGEGLTVRNRREGDFLKFNNFTKSLKKFFIDKKVPFSLRWKIPLVLFKGEIIYIPRFFKKEAYIKGDKTVKVRFVEGEGNSTNNERRDRKQN